MEGFSAYIKQIGSIKEDTLAELQSFFKQIQLSKKKYFLKKENMREKLAF